MAKKPRPNKPADELKLEIARSRDEVARDLRALRYELDIPRRIRRSFREQTAVWIGAAAVVGTLIVLLPLRRKKVYVDLASGDKRHAEEQTSRGRICSGRATNRRDFAETDDRKFRCQKNGRTPNSSRPVAIARREAVKQMSF